MSIDFRHPNRPAGRLGVRAADPSRVGQRHVDTLQRTLKIECCLPFVTVVKVRRAGNGRNFDFRIVQARTTAVRFPTWPAKHRFKSSNFSSPQPCALNEANQHSCGSCTRAATVRLAPPVSMHARRSQAAAPRPHSQAPLCPASVFDSRI